jgi:DNA-binding PadR family transcriptional regulator
MNTLSYALLSLIARAPLSGYDLLQQMKQRVGPMWPVRHSQIYPELARMEEQGLITYEVVEQVERPAKKVYHLTDAGRQALRQWVTEPTQANTLRDEFILKAYSLWLADPQQALARFREQQQEHIQRRGEHEATLARLRQSWGAELDQPRSPLFSSAIALRYAIGYEQHYLAWLQQVIEALEQAHPGA